jgi:hypothetical protein
MGRPQIAARNGALDLECMPGANRAMQRLDAWYQSEILDRVPVRFIAHNEFLDAPIAGGCASAEERKARWFDVEYQVDVFERSIQGRTFYGETFPIYWPNLGPNVYAAFYGLELEFGEVTSWTHPAVRHWDDLDGLELDPDNIYLQKIDELTQHALERCPGKYLVGYTDLHPGLDCAAAWRGMDQLCLDMVDHPEEAEGLARLSIADFQSIYDHFDARLRAAGQPSSSWMGIPCFGRMHIPSCDFSALISPRFFEQYALPILEHEVQTMTHNIFHVDGKRVARHLDMILSVPQVHAIQWVQGVGDDQPIMQWVPFIQEIQARGVPVIVDLRPEELDDFMAAMEPEGVFLWLATESEEQELSLLNKIERWT